MLAPWWRSEAKVKRRALQAVRAALRQHGPDWVAFLERRWERKWRDIWPDYASDFALAADEAEAEDLLRQLVERLVDWVADYFLEEDVPPDAPDARQPQRIRAERTPSLARRQAQVARLRWLVNREKVVQDARALLGNRLLTAEEALLVLRSPLLARWGLLTWQLSAIPLVHHAEVVFDSATIAAYRNQQVAALRRRGMTEAEATEWVREQQRGREVVRVTWDDGERLVSVPHLPAIERTLLVRDPLWLRIDDPSRLPPDWRWPEDVPPQPVWVKVKLPVVLRGSILAHVYQAAERVQQVLGYPFAEAVRWVLTGETEEDAAVGWSSAHVGAIGQGPGWVQLTLATGLPGEVVLMAYRSAVEQVSRWLEPASTSTRPLDERTLALARFWHEEVERTGRAVTYEALRREWNARHPAWSYRHASSFWRALRQAVRDVYGVALPRRYRSR